MENRKWKKERAKRKHNHDGTKKMKPFRIIK